MDDERLLAIVAAIATLKPEESTKAGPPKADALVAAFGSPLTADERAQGWEKFKTDNPTATDAKEVTTTFSTEGATSVITHRDGGPKRIWFRDGKEIGVENVG
jgi:hypothetical protein